jgi:hypothetical protein
MEFDGDQFDHLSQLGELDHKPITGPRPSHVGENVFAHQWELLMQKRESEEDPPNAALARILWNMTHGEGLTQRHASVAASFITWLGTNCGNALIEKSRRLYIAMDSVSQLSREDAFVAAWAIENMRKPGRYRVIDSVLAPPDHWLKDVFTNQTVLGMIPPLSADDLETCDHVAYWCGSPEGCEFIRLCNWQIRQRERTSTEESIRIMAGVSK